MRNIVVNGRHVGYTDNTYFYNLGMTNLGFIVFDNFGNFIGIIQENRVYDSGGNLIGYIDNFGNVQFYE